MLRRGIGPQKSQRRRLIELAEQGQSHRVIGFETGGELIEQARLHLDQSILVAGQFFQLLDQLAVRVEPMQVGKVRTSGLGQQVRINGIGFRSRWGAVPIHGAWVDGIDRPVMRQQVANQQAVRCFDDAGHLFASRLADEVFQIRIQTAQPFRGMSNPDCSQLAALLINGQGSWWSLAQSIPQNFMPALLSWKTMRFELLCPYTVSLEA